MRDVHHDARNHNQAEIRRYVKNHLDYGVVMICCALWVRNGKCPVLGEWSADDAEVDDFNDEEGANDVAKQDPEGELESRKHAAIEVSRPRSHGVLRGGWVGENSAYTTRRRKVHMQIFTPHVVTIILCSRPMTTLDPKIRFFTSAGLARIEASCSGG